ncbi:MAG: filamentous hemagglutinin N-terminal domain-containing protein, partial [Acidocella sp.]|nr:filamentous hemagglutinin N-terminal domain-containing protein [Acidocella sp.]
MQRKTATAAPELKSKKLWRGALLASTCISGIFTALPGHAQSLAPNTTPTGGVVAGGSASITQAPNLTTIDQTSQKTIIDWQTFNVGSAATVDFVQPSSNAVALNRVITPSPSIIAGKIDANGQLILINQSGIVFTKGSEVDTQGLVATTSDVSDQAFLAGKLNFTGAPRPGAAIINDGKITVKDTGLVGLVAPQVANNGVITAQLGQVVLAGASAFTLDLYGDRLMSIDVTQAVRAVDVGGKLVPALVTNSGIIIADGGKITLTAQDADALVTQLINAGGTIRANSVGAQTGTISISGVGGNIAIAGNLLAQGTQAGTKGGAVEALSDGTVAVQPGATINTSGDAGGGVIALGTNITRAQQGAADITAPRAKAVSVAGGAFLLSNATGSGNGGTVTLLSTDNTDFAGAISVLGGPNGGNGGLAEISSGNVINLSGTVADTALHGRDGEILLDPATLVVGSGTTAAGSVVSGSSATFGTDSSTVSYISPSVLDTLTGTIILEASTLVSVLSAVSITGSGTALTITSGGDVSVGSSIFVNGSLEIDAANSLNIAGNLTAADISLNSGTAGTDINSGVTAASGNLIFGSIGAIFEGTNGLIKAGNIYSNGSIGGDVSLTSGSNVIGTLDNFTAANLTLNDQGGLTVGPSVSAGNISLSAASITFEGDVSAKGLLALASTGTIYQGQGGISAATLTGSANGLFALDKSGNSIGSLGLVSATGGDFSLHDTGVLTVNGPVSGTTVSLSSDFIDLAGNITAPTQLALESAGTITQTTGAISTGTLSGTAVGNVVLNGSANTIATLGSFSAPNLSLADNGTLN